MFPGMAKSSQDTQILKTLIENGCDPLAILAKAATGDVVGLGLLSQEEYDEEEIYDGDGLIETLSGADKALLLIPMKTRIEAAKELAGYVYAKKKAGEQGSATKVGGTLFYLPDNNRAPGVPHPAVRIEEPEEDDDVIDVED